MFKPQHERVVVLGRIGFSGTVRPEDATTGPIPRKLFAAYVMHHAHPAGLRGFYHRAICGPGDITPHPEFPHAEVLEHSVDPAQITLAGALDRDPSQTRQPATHTAGRDH